jgi:hypothetical protein
MDINRQRCSQNSEHERVVCRPVEPSSLLTNSLLFNTIRGMCIDILFAMLKGDNSYVYCRLSNDLD